MNGKKPKILWERAQSNQTVAGSPSAILSPSGNDNIAKSHQSHKLEKLDELAGRINSDMASNIFSLETQLN